MKKYPILNSNGEYIPYEMILEHEAQCLINHSQSVEKLASRGGTDYIETFYISRNGRYKFHDVEDTPRLMENARRIVQAMSYEWLMKNNKLD